MRKYVVKSRHQQLIEGQLGEPIEATLSRLYVTEGLSQAEISVQLGVSRQAVVRWMAQFSIKTRGLPEPLAEAVA